jgi:hypothetical protein
MTPAGYKTHRAAPIPGAALVVVLVPVPTPRELTGRESRSQLRLFLASDWTGRICFASGLSFRVGKGSSPERVKASGFCARWPFLFRCFQRRAGDANVEGCACHRGRIRGNL